MPEIKEIKALPRLEKKQRVAGYCRVSSGKDEQLHSLSVQVGYFKERIVQHPGWEFAGVFYDEAKTGTKESRSGFQELLIACRSGQVDMVLTKSISRFARNTVTLLETVRELKALGVDVFFEEQNIHTKSSDGELMLTILASYAQEESLSASENQKWRIKKNFEAGIPWNSKLLGYRLKDGKYEIVPEEAETVKRIFELYLSGMGPLKISKTLNAEGKRTIGNNLWRPNGVSDILRNDTYTGNLTLQKTYREDHISKRTRKNRGEYPQYKVEESHDAIIPKEMFETVQEEIARRAEEWETDNRKSVGVFTGKIICANCGRHYRRRTVRRGYAWQCFTYETMGKSACASKRVPEDILISACSDTLGLPAFDEDVFKNEISKILVYNGNKLIFHFVDGNEKEYIWQDRSRSESWTDEMKEAARQNALARKGESLCRK